MKCQREEREAGRAYPRTCPTCKLGPCQKLGAKPLQSLADAQAEIARLTAALDAMTNRAEVAEYKQRQAVQEVQPIIIARAEKAEVERDTARAETAMAFEVAAGDCAEMAHQVSDAALTGIPEQARMRESMEAAFTKANHRIRSLTPAHATAALEADRKAQHDAGRIAGMREALHLMENALAQPQIGTARQIVREIILARAAELEAGK